jgi:hypothetical protein
MAALAAAAVAVVVGAALIAWSAYSRSVDAAAPPDMSAGPAAPTQAVPTQAASAGGPDARTSAPPAGHRSGDPAGYRWYQVIAASTSTGAGLEIAVPASWQMSTQGLVTRLNPPAGTAFIQIGLAPFTYSRPVREAAFLQAQALGQDQYPGYRLVALGTGTFRGTPDATWRFSWDQAGAGRVAVLTLLVKVGTPAGTRPCALTVSAPASGFAAAEAVFRRALATFRPLP